MELYRESIGNRQTLINLLSILENNILINLFLLNNRQYMLSEVSDFRIYIES